MTGWPRSANSSIRSNFAFCQAIHVYRTEFGRGVIDRKKAGVDVRVQLNAARSGGDRANDETYEQFQSAGVASLMYVVTLFWQKAQKSKWRIAVEKGFAPLTVGLIIATSLVMSRGADHDWRAYLLTALCTVIFIRTKANPLIVVFAAGVLGYFGIV